MSLVQNFFPVILKTKPVQELHQGVSQSGMQVLSEVVM